MKRQRSTYNQSFRSVLSIVARRLCLRLATEANRSNRGILMPLLTLGFLFSALSGVSRADPYWVAWEGNDYPENEGWTRGHYGDDGPPAIRSLSGGVMTLDGLSSIEIVDAYRMFRPLNPEAGEEFVVQWGLRVDEVGNPNSRFDPGLAIYSDDAWHFILVLGVDDARSILEQEDIAFDPGVFHAWEFRSADMRSYRLLLDGAVVRAGTFVQSGAVESRISWGDLVAGSNSLSDWDYFRFGIVPEPASCISMLALLSVARASNFTRRIR